MTAHAPTPGCSVPRRDREEAEVYIRAVHTHPEQQQAVAAAAAAAAASKTSAKEIM